LYCQYPSWEEFINDIPSHEIEKHTDAVAIIFATQVAHFIVIDALVKEGKGSNYSAEFVNSWIQYNLPNH